jgi:hypothetical protein
VTNIPTKAVPQLGQLRGAGRLLFGPFAEKGLQVDVWADVLEGMADKAQAVLEALDERVKDAQIPQLELRDETISGSGLQAERRNYRIVQRGPGLMAVFIARLGKDLYVSWRLFAGPLSRAKIRNWLIVCTIIGLLLGSCSLCTGLGGLAGLAGRGDLIDKLGRLFLSLVGTAVGIVASIIAVVILLSLLGLLLGWWAARDPLLFWRERLDEFAQDEVAALAIDVHKKLLGAIDAVGIDTALLLKKEDFALTGRRSRLI